MSSTAEPTVILEAEKLQKNFGKMAAVNKFDLTLIEGELVTVIGPNGAGKTTLINLLTGKLKPSGGKVYFRGRDITGRRRLRDRGLWENIFLLLFVPLFGPFVLFFLLTERWKPHHLSRLGMARTFQITNLFPDLTVYENIRVPVLARFKKTTSWLTFDSRHRDVNEETERLLQIVRLTDKAGEEAGTLSHGEQRLLEVGVALAARPVLLLLDEPTGGMDPDETEAMVSFVRELAATEGITILMVEHDMNVVFAISDRIVVMHQGMLLSEGLPDEIRADPKVREAYLGE
ncbi:MAG: ABC transporter ATP-binding protein [Proteobacteria bacterium]|nr:ABC transporter ATP-binding protein [Pseudomonadota bacterium]MBU1742361.1 ABC transporter ATP-binding protein [Pseudomonadota bacterium]